MSVITMTSRNTRRNARATTNSAVADATDSEFQGFWINVGIKMPNGQIARLNRGIAVDDLVTRKVYESTDPQYAKEIALTNKAVAILRKLSTKKRMDEGEAIPLPNLTVFLYRKQEGTEMDDDNAGLAEMEAFLLGTADDGYDDENEKPVPAVQTNAKNKVTRTQVEADDEDDDILGRKAR